MIDTAIDVIAKGAVEHAKDVAQDAVQQVQQLAGKTSKKRRTPRVSRVWLLFGVAGVAAIIIVVMRRRSSERFAEPVPDVFGTAVEEERAAQAYGQHNLATPGA